MRAKEVHNNKIRLIDPRTREPGCDVLWRDEVLTQCSGSQHPSSLPVEGAERARVSAPPAPWCHVLVSTGVVRHHDDPGGGEDSSGGGKDDARGIPGRTRDDMEDDVDVDLDTASRGCEGRTGEDRAREGSATRRAMGSMDENNSKWGVKRSSPGGKLQRKPGTQQR